MILYYSCVFGVVLLLFAGVADESFASGYLDAPPAAKPTDGRPRQQKQQMNEEMVM